MVGRIELMTPERERLAAAAVQALAHPDGVRRSQAFAYLREQGRYVEPIVRRVQRTTSDENVRVLCRRLLLTDFVTELRSSIHSASDGSFVNSDPRLLRAHLARVLREIGLDKEARMEGTNLLNELKRISTSVEATPANHFMMQELSTIKAAALEACGIDRSAADVYAECIEGRFNTIGRFDNAVVDWFREWWVGRSYGRSVMRAGESGLAVARLRERIAQGVLDPSGREKRLACLLLAYIHEARGEQLLANQSWEFFLAADPQPKAKWADTKVALGSGKE
jgi:hypothetical protein